MAFIQYVVKEILIAIVFLVALLLPSILVSWAMDGISNSIRRRFRFFGNRAFLYLTAPGVAVHELSHAIFCLIFGHKILKLNLFSPEEDGTLGYVEHGYNSRNLYQRIGNFFIGTGPIRGGFLFLYVTSKLVLPEEVFSSELFRDIALGNDTGKDYSKNIAEFFKYFFSATTWRSFSFYIWLYVSLSVSAHITLSPADIKGAKDGFIFFSGIVVLAFLLFGWCGSWEINLLKGLVLVYSQQLSVILINVIALLIIRFFGGLIPFST